VVDLATGGWSNRVKRSPLVVIGQRGGTVEWCGWNERNTPTKEGWMDTSSFRVARASVDGHSRDEVGG